MTTSPKEDKATTKEAPATTGADATEDGDQDQRAAVPRVEAVTGPGQGRGRTGEQRSHGPVIITRRNRRTGAPTPVRPRQSARATVDHAMKDPDEFDQFYKDVRTRLLVLTYCLTGDMACRPRRPTAARARQPLP